MLKWLGVYFLNLHFTSGSILKTDKSYQLYFLSHLKIEAKYNIALVHFQFFFFFASIWSTDFGGLWLWRAEQPGVENTSSGSSRECGAPCSVCLVLCFGRSPKRTGLFPKSLYHSHMWRQEQELCLIPHSTALSLREEQWLESSWDKGSEGGDCFVMLFDVKASVLLLGIV